MIERYARLLCEAGCLRGADIQLREGYSGRAMGEQQTTAVVVDRLQTLFPLIAEVASGLMGMGEEEFVDVCAGLRTDNMGRGVIVY